MSLEIAAATPDDLPAVLAILDEAGAWLHSIGITEQWPAVFSTDPTWVDFYVRMIAQGKIFLARVDGAPAGSYVLDAQPHREGTDLAWPEGSDHALILYKLAVRRDHAGKGVASRMLDWALQHAHDSGLQELRLDCWAGNERLKRYYIDAGFVSCGDIEHTETELGSGRTYSVSRFSRRVQ